MTNNMGTPAHPEGLPHFSVKALMAHKLVVALRPKSPRQYATFLPSEFREVSLDDSMPAELKQAFERVMERLDSRPPYSFLIFNEPPHGDCEGGVMVVDILQGCQGGYVSQEQPFAGYIPDIAVYPSADAAQPSCIIEVVDTSPPSDQKLRAMERLGVAVYELAARQKNPLSVLEEPVPVRPLVLPPCGQSLRREMERLERFWDQAGAPFVGIKFYPSGTQAYLYGEQETGSTSWTHGDPEIRGIGRLEHGGKSVPHVTPVGRPRTLKRETFMAFLMWLKGKLITVAHMRASEKGHEWGGSISLNGVEATFICHIDDLMHMVRYPR
ncbi:MAG: hypothetical protein F4X66_14455 [Chloroflexi bacterium]|nr:hypothetical protein [Chloroflexota bacterium]MYE40790.1 hypothetical protein [Chloroflexota bacterium]